MTDNPYPGLTDEDLAKLPTFGKRITARQALSALAEQQIESARRTQIGDLLLGHATRRQSRLGEVICLYRPDRGPDGIIVINDGVYVVEVHDKSFGDTWTTVVDGKTDHNYFSGDNARWTAVLHAIARKFGDDDYRATAAFYGARVLGIPEDRAV